MSSRERSCAYPALSLPDALRICRTIFEEVGDTALNRDEMARILGYRSGAGGLAARKIAALVHYGLHQRSKGLYRPSGLAQELRNAAEDSTRRALTRQAFQNPALFAAILSQYQLERRVPRQLAFALPQFGISEKVAGEVASIFMTSGVYASVLREDGAFLLQEPAPNQQPAEGTSFPAPGEPSREQLERIPILLTQQRRAFIEVPLDLTAQDIGILRQQLETFAARVEEDRVAPILSWEARARTKPGS